jgi:hypothetical protein
VARELLGKILVRRLTGHVLSGKIVETEAYYGENDPASKAYKGRKPFNEPMFREAGKTFIYLDPCSSRKYYISEFSKWCHECGAHLPKQRLFLAKMLSALPHSISQ